MIRTNPIAVTTDSSGREMYDYREMGGILFNIIANDTLLGYVVPHWHHEMEVYLQTAGSATVNVNGESFPLDVGEGCFVNSGALHEFRATGDGPSAYRSFVFDASIVSGMIGSIFEVKYIQPLMTSGPCVVRFSADDAAYVEAFDRAFDALVGEAHAYEFKVRNALSDILLQVIDSASVEGDRPKSRLKEVLAKQMIDWINAHLTEDIGLIDIAASASISPRECQRIFRQYLHRSPIGYLNLCRLYAAAQSLTDLNSPVTEIAMRYGFTSPSYFAQQFRREFGMTPRDYRRIHAPEGQSDD